MTLEPASARNEMQPMMSFSDVFYRTVRVPFAITWPALQCERVLRFVTCGYVSFGAWSRSWWIPCNRLQRRGTKRGLQKECMSPEIFWIKVSTFSILAPAFYNSHLQSEGKVGRDAGHPLIKRQPLPHHYERRNWEPLWRSYRVLLGVDYPSHLHGRILVNRM